MKASDATGTEFDLRQREAGELVEIRSQPRSPLVPENRRAEKPQEGRNDGLAISGPPKGAHRLENPKTAASLSNTTVFERLQELLHPLDLRTSAVNRAAVRLRSRASKSLPPQSFSKASFAKKSK